jgi:hypothetical protein
MAQSYGVGASLASYGITEQKQAMDLYGEAASEEAKRNAQNAEIEAQRKAGNAQLGAIAGAEFGSAAGPWGTLIGGLVGALGSRLF